MSSSISLSVGLSILDEATDVARSAPLVWLLLLLLRHNAEGLTAQGERLATSPSLVTMLHLLHAIVVRLHARKINIDILKPETVGTVCV